MTISPNFSISSVDNRADINIFVNNQPVSHYELEDSMVTLSERTLPTLISLNELKININLILNWTTLIKRYISNLINQSYSFESELKKSENFEAKFEGESTVTQLTCDLATKEFVFLPRNEVTVSFSLFERWVKFLLSCTEDVQ